MTTTNNRTPRVVGVAQPRTNQPLTRAHNNRTNIRTTSKHRSRINTDTNPTPTNQPTTPITPARRNRTNCTNRAIRHNPTNQLGRRLNRRNNTPAKPNTTNANITLFKSRQRHTNNSPPNTHTNSTATRTTNQPNHLNNKPNSLPHSLHRTIRMQTIHKMTRGNPQINPAQLQLETTQHRCKITPCRPIQFPRPKTRRHRIQLHTAHPPRAQPTKHPTNVLRINTIRFTQTDIPRRKPRQRHRQRTPLDLLHANPSSNTPVVPTAARSDNQ